MFALADVRGRRIGLGDVGEVGDMGDGRSVVVLVVVGVEVGVGSGGEQGGKRGLPVVCEPSRSSQGLVMDLVVKRKPSCVGGFG